MPDLGDVLLYALSASKQWTWQAFRDAYDELYTRKTRASAVIVEDPDRHQRRRAMTLMDALGHCDVTFDTGGDNVYVTPAALFALPTAGLPRAVLSGMRSPETVRELRGAATRQIQIAVSQQQRTSTLVPSRIEIQAESSRVLDEFARSVDVTYEKTPAGWLLSLFSGSVERYLESLTWAERPDLTWPRSDFSPSRLHFGARSIDGDSQLILSRYQDPVRGRFLYRLWKGTTSADVEPSWGRYTVLRDQPRILDYQERGGLVSVPTTVPLPRLIARALTMCSGYAPTVRPRLDEWASSSREFDIYRAVPPDVYELLAAKLGQSEQLSHTE